jgi:hypothetical protein
VNRLIAVFGLFLLPASTAFAAPSTTGAGTYEVEVLVFENRLPSLEGGELWTREPGKTPDLAEAASGEPPPPDSSLAAAAVALERDGNYRILAHTRWTQNAEAKTATKAFRVRSADGQLDGVVRFYLARFLHLDVDLLLRESKSGVLSTLEGNGAQTYRINEHRRVKTVDISYFDHPKFGALVRVVQTGKE